MESRPTLGELIRALRARNGWTLKQMSDATGIAISTLSKVERDLLTLAYDKLQQISTRLNIRLSELLGEAAPIADPKVTARRSVGDIGAALRVNTDNYDYYYLCTELRRKRMIPIITRIRTKTLEEFGELIRHSGEEFLYVLQGRIVVHSDFYHPMALDEGQFIYIDSEMGHAYLTGDGCDEAVVLAICSSEEDEHDLISSLMNLPAEQAHVLTRD